MSEKGDCDGEFERKRKGTEDVARGVGVSGDTNAEVLFNAYLTSIIMMSMMMMMFMVKKMRCDE